MNLEIFFNYLFSVGSHIYDALLVALTARAIIFGPIGRRQESIKQVGGHMSTKPETSQDIHVSYTWMIQILTGKHLSN